MKKLREVLFAAAFVLAAAVLLNLCAGALRPPRDGYGAQWQAYLDEAENSIDYLCLGSSYAYCDVNPALVYASSGLTGCVMAGPEQTFSTTFWYLRRALKTQSPKYVLIEATALGFERSMNFTQVNIDYMPMSLDRLGAAFCSAEDELRTGLVFPLYFYHGRWKEPFLPGYEPEPEPDPEKAEKSKGYTAVYGTHSEISSGPFSRRLPEESVYKANLKDLGSVLRLCRRAGAQPVVVLHPTYSRFSEAERERIRADVSALDPGALFFDWSGETDAIGIDPELHFYDPGHLNAEGAGIFSSWLGQFMLSELGAVPRVQTEENAAAWLAAVEYWQGA